MFKRSKVGIFLKNLPYPLLIFGFGLYILMICLEVLIKNHITSNQYLEGFGDGLKWITRGIPISLMISAFIKTYDKVDFKKFKTFLRFFNIKQYEKIAVVIPEFDRNYFIENLMASGYEIKNPSSLNDYHSTKAFNSKGDLHAAKYIVSLFQKNTTFLPDLISDKEALDEIKKGSKKYKTYVVIGIHSNLIAREFIFKNDQNQSLLREGDLVKEKIDDYINNLRFIPGARTNDPKARTFYLRHRGHNTFDKIAPCISNDEVVDIGVIIKGTIDRPKESFNFFLLGGLNPTGTHRMGEYLYYHWEEIAKQSVLIKEGKTTKSILELNPFTMVFKVNQKNQKSFSGYETETFIRIDNRYL